MMPPTPAQLGAAATAAARDARRNHYARLLAKGNDRELAAETVGISERTRQRYEAQLREAR
ncbi:hypothetical protein GCM10009555_018080 [Acrocarpospora macrocephala]|uniref:Uncharacterized protein n=1 Tax=Acrocarpospora macrocephala TaxID=150177 RepID=A0A5M3WMC2_9ACTN|nr:hypothetical protein [Acrocarpospora macrocephala]GES07468.1 hypothetical protein Amac_010630 [Acrocarpospora macrocephala]